MLSGKMTRGCIISIKENQYGQEYGFIWADNETYYFDSRSLAEGHMTDYYQFDLVEFEPVINRVDSRKKAHRVRLSEESSTQSSPYIGQIKKLNVSNGKIQTGFISCDSKTYFLHPKFVDPKSLPVIREKDIVEFDKCLIMPGKEDIAVNVRLHAPDVFSDEDLERVYHLLDETYQDNAEILLAEFGNLLLEHGLNYKKDWGLKSVSELCDKYLKSFVDLKRVSVTNGGTNTRAIFHKRTETGMLPANHSRGQQSRGIADIEHEIYVLLLNHFRPNKQTKSPAIVKILGENGFKASDFGFRDPHDFFEQFNFLTVERNLYIDNMPANYVTIHRVSEWDENQLKENNGDLNFQTPGIAVEVCQHFSEWERQAVVALSSIIYIGDTGVVDVNGTGYSYATASPTTLFHQRFGINKEILILFSRCVPLESNIRGISYCALQEISKTTTHNVERMCAFLVGEDLDVVKQIRDASVDISKAVQILIPFSTKELIEQHGNLPHELWLEFVLRRVSEDFYSRDLFAMDSAITEDAYFFGRQDYVHNIVQKLLNHECAGIFGLRKSGKTSVLNAITRELDYIVQPNVTIDCSGLDMLSWNEALYRLVESVYEDLSIGAVPHALYNRSDAVRYFEEDMLTVIHKLETGNLVLLFDEVEQITFDISDSVDWRENGASTHFWKLIRRFHQKHIRQFAFAIAGTNPFLVERPLTRSGADNPLYRAVSTGKDKYLPMFSQEETKSMLKKLGSYMGLAFDDAIYIHITEDYGGQPYIIRQFCSRLNSFIEGEPDREKPLTISRTVYDRIKKEFDESEVLDSYCEMILDVLQKNYPEEYRMLECIALDDHETIRNQAGNKAATEHLEGYGIIEKDGKFWGFKNNAVRSYIVGQKKYNRLIQTPEERINEINERRSHLELTLRDFVRRTLRSHCGEDEAKKKVVSLFKERRNSDWKEEFEKLQYKDLFDPKKNRCCYFYDLFVLIEHNWEYFKNSIDDEKTFHRYWQSIANFRTIGAHSDDSIDAHQFEVFRAQMEWIENQINNAI